MAVIVTVIFLLLSFTTANAATLFDCEWDAGTGCTVTNVRGGAFTAGGDQSNCDGEGCPCWNVTSGGPNGRNLLQLVRPSTGSDWIYGHSPSFSANPIYIRFWVNRRGNSGIYHPLIIGDIPQPGTGDGVYLIRFASTSDNRFCIAGYIIDSNSIYYGPVFTIDQWYRVEYKISDAGGSSGSIEIRIDGVDETANFTRDGGTLAGDNGSLNLNAVSYIALETYQGGAGQGHYLDIAGLKITDDGWIGGDEAAAPVLQSQAITDNGSVLTLTFDKTAYQGPGYGDADLNLDSSGQGNDIALTCIDCDASDTWTYYIAKAIPTGDTVDLDLTDSTAICDDALGTTCIATADITNEVVTVSAGHDATNWYVTPDGAGAKNGSSKTNAWETLANVVQGSTGVGLWDTLYIGDDSVVTFRETLTPSESGSNGNEITFTAYNSDYMPIISGADLDPGTGWTLESGEYYKTYTTEPKVVIGDGSLLTKGTVGVLNVGEWGYSGTELYLKNNPTSYLTLEVGQRDCIVIDNKSYIMIDHIKMQYASNPGGNVVGGGIYTTEGSNHITIQYCSIEKCWSSGILFNYGDTLVADHNTITEITNETLNRGDGICVRGMNGSPYNPSTNVTLSANTITKVSRQGIAIIGLSIGTVINNIISDTSYSMLNCIDLEPNTNDTISNIVISDNVLTQENGGENGITVDGSIGILTDVTLRENLIDMGGSVDKYGILFETTGGTNLVTKNVITNLTGSGSQGIRIAGGSIVMLSYNYIDMENLVGYGVYARSTSNVTTLANLILNADRCVVSDSGATLTMNHDMFLNFDNFGIFTYGNCTCKNAIFSTTGTVAYIVRVDNEGSTFAFDNNDYYTPDDSTSLFRLGANSYNTLANWQTALGGNCPSDTNNDCHSLTSDPLLNADYTLKTASPCRNAADGPHDLIDPSSIADSWFDLTTMSSNNMGPFGSEGGSLIMILN